MAGHKKEYVKGEQLHSRIKVIAGIILFGSLWGMLEATLGGILHYVGIVNPGPVMASTGFSILAFAVAIYGKPWIAPYIGLVAASEKFLGFIIFPWSSWGKIIRPATGIFLESLLFGAVTAIMWNEYREKAGSKVLCTSLASYLGMFAYGFLGWTIFRSGIGANRNILVMLKDIGFSATLTFMLSAFLVPAGHWLGNRVRDYDERMALKDPAFYYSMATIASVWCWIVAFITTVKGP